MRQNSVNSVNVLQMEKRVVMSHYLKRLNKKNKIKKMNEKIQTKRDLVSSKLHKAPIKLSKETVGNTTDDFIMDKNTEVTQNKDMIARRTSSRTKKALVTKNTDFLW
jgi:hypothetical protein